MAALPPEQQVSLNFECNSEAAYIGRTKDTCIDSSACALYHFHSPRPPHTHSGLSRGICPVVLL